MDQIKFRYVYKHINNIDYMYKYFTLEQIEQGNFPIFFEYVDYTLIARDRYTGSKDLNNTEIYERDILQDSFRTYDHVWFNDSMFVAGKAEVEVGYMNKDCKVVGNTYEHNNLLKR